MCVCNVVVVSFCIFFTNAFQKNVVQLIVSCFFFLSYPSFDKGGHGMSRIMSESQDQEGYMWIDDFQQIMKK
eukprot:m.208695 g.208695  ORF g.208695 m.208695 type:complete len:72 (+) comp13768_c1_seq2:423-638(+)